MSARLRSWREPCRIEIALSAKTGMPANAGIQSHRAQDVSGELPFKALARAAIWIPAFAGMTTGQIAELVATLPHLSRTGMISTVSCTSSPRP